MISPDLTTSSVPDRHRIGFSDRDLLGNKLSRLFKSVLRMSLDLPYGHCPGGHDQPCRQNHRLRHKIVIDVNRFCLFWRLRLGFVPQMSLFLSPGSSPSFQLLFTTRALYHG